MSLHQSKKPKLLKGYHWHHIIPRHLGGTDDLSNLVLISPLDHAIAHFVRYKMEKRQADAWAYNRLMNQAKCSGIRLETAKPNLGRKFSDEVNMKKGSRGEKNGMARPEIREKHRLVMSKLIGTGVFSNKGKDNPAAKPIKINGISFECLQDAANFYDVGRDTVRKWANGAKPQKKHRIETIEVS
jgi:hypothetical protein